MRARPEPESPPLPAVTTRPSPTACNAHTHGQAGSMQPHRAAHGQGMGEAPCDAALARGGTNAGRRAAAAGTCACCAAARLWLAWWGRAVIIFMGLRLLKRSGCRVVCRAVAALVWHRAEPADEHIICKKKCMHKKMYSGGKAEERTYSAGAPAQPYPDTLLCMPLHCIGFFVRCASPCALAWTRLYGCPCPVCSDRGYLPPAAY